MVPTLGKGIATQKLETDPVQQYAQPSASASKCRDDVAIRPCENMIKVFAFTFYITCFSLAFCLSSLFFVKKKLI